jgi:hypothetical protein
MFGDILCSSQRDSTLCGDKISLACSTVLCDTGRATTAPMHVSSVAVHPHSQDSLATAAGDVLVCCAGMPGCGLGCCGCVQTHVFLGSSTTHFYSQHTCIGCRVREAITKLCASHDPCSSCTVHANCIHCPGSPPPEHPPCPGLAAHSTRCRLQHHGYGPAGQ